MREAMRKVFHCFLLAMFVTSPVTILSEEVEQGTNELSVPPLDHVVYPHDRPAWILSANTDRRFVVRTEPYEKSEDASLELINLKRLAASQLLESAVQNGLAVSKDPLLLDILQIDALLLQRSYEGTVLVGGVEHYECSAELEITDEVLGMVKSYLQGSTVGARIRQIMIILAGLVIALWIAAGLIDHQIKREEDSLTLGVQLDRSGEG